MPISSHHSFSPQQKILLNRIGRLLPKGKLYIVGGTIRDILLHRTVHDLDVLIQGVSLAHLRKKLTAVGSVHFVGKRFGTLKIRPHRLRFDIDVAVPRREIARGTGGYRDFSFRTDPHLSIERDLARRDFTVNAMALEWKTKRLIDPYNGQRDVQRKILQTVGNSSQRFQEDYSRLLRLVRLASELNFSLEPSTKRMAKALAPKLVSQRDGNFIVPREVLAEQLIRAFVADPPRAFDLFAELGYFRVLLPEIERLRGCRQSSRFHSEGDVWQHTRLALNRLASSAWRKTFPGEPPDALLVFATLFHDIGKPESRKSVVVNGKRRMVFHGHDLRGAERTNALCQRLKLSSYQGLVPCDELTWLVRYHLLGLELTLRSMRSLTLANYFSGTRGQHLLQLIWADQSASITASGRPVLGGFRLLRQRLRRVLKGRKTLPPALATGHDVMRWCGLAPGPSIGRLLEQLREQQLSGNVTTRLAARRFLKKQSAKNRG